MDIIKKEHPFSFNKRGDTDGNQTSFFRRNAVHSGIRALGQTRRNRPAAADDGRQAFGDGGGGERGAYPPEAVFDGIFPLRTLPHRTTHLYETVGLVS